MSSSKREADEWLKTIRQDFKKQLKSGVTANVCVFQVPKSLRTVKPEHYEPQMIGLGPYNQLKPELKEMERSKLEATCRLLRVFQVQDFDSLTNNLAKLDPYVRACYHKSLDLFEESKLAWIMAVDSAFLFYFICHRSIDPTWLESSQYLTDIAGPIGRKLSEDEILRDVMMLENQVPFFFMKQMLALLCSPTHDSGNEEDEQRHLPEEIFPQILLRFCETLSPVKCTADTKDLASKALKCAHLLDLLHVMVVPREEEIFIDIPLIDNADQLEAYKEKASKEKSIVPVMIGEATGIIEDAVSESGLKEIAPKLLEAATKSKSPVGKQIKSHATMVKGVLDIQLEFAELIARAFLSIQRKAEDFLLPTVSQLAWAGVTFEKINSIQDIRFDETQKTSMLGLKKETTGTLYLPVLQIGVNTEVIIRNLVAYEAMAMHKSLKFARYVELMNGLIETVDDVKLLKDSNVLISYMKDDEVTTIFNDTTKSIQLSKDDDIDSTIKKLNTFYNESSRTKARKAGKLFWKTLALVAVVLYLLLMFLESFCTAYSCHRTT